MESDHRYTRVRRFGRYWPWLYPFRVVKDGCQADIAGKPYIRQGGGLGDFRNLCRVAGRDRINAEVAQVGSGSASPGKRLGVDLRDRGR